MFAIAKIFISLFLGQEKTHFLVVLQNNNEIRATGGFITKVVDFYLGKFRAKVHFRDVFKDLDKHEYNEPPEHEYVEPPKPIGEMLNNPNNNSWTLRDANFDPDFNKSASKIAEFYNLVHPKNKVNGILAVNFSFIENLLEIVGPVKLDNFIVSKENLFMFLSSKTANIDRHDLKSRRARKNILKIVYKKLIKKCIFSIHKWGKVNKLTKESLHDKNLQIWLTDKQKLAKLNLPKFNYGNADDCLAVIDSNFLGGKSNRYIKRTITREVEFTKETANIQLTIMWENFGRENYPLSIRYKGYVRIYLPKEAIIAQESETIGDFKVIGKKQEIQLNEKQIIKINYSLKNNFLNAGKYKFKFIKQSGVVDENLIESYITPVQYAFKATKTALVRENVCTLNNMPKKDTEYELNINKSKFGTIIVSHELIDPVTAHIRFSQPVQKEITVRCFNKETKHEHKVLHTEWLANNTILDIKISSIPHDEEEFYILELTNFEKNPRKVSIVYRSKFFSSRPH